MFALYIQTLKHVFKRTGPNSIDHLEKGNHYEDNPGLHTIKFICS